MKESQKIALRRAISLPLLIFYGLGNIIGAGIYVLVGEIARSAGIYAPISFVFAFVIVLFSALAYAELSSRYPLSAGVALYLQQAFGMRAPSVVVGMLIMLSAMTSAGALLHGFYGYISLYVHLPEFLVSLFLLSVLGGIAIWGIDKTVLATSFFTLLEVAGLAMVIWAGKGSFSFAALAGMIPSLDPSVWQGIAVGGLIAFFAFLGFEDMVNVAEEVKNPRRVVPAAIIITLSIATVLYIVVAAVSVLVVAPDELSRSSAPLAEVYRIASGRDPLYLGLIGLFSAINGIVVQIILASRMLYGMSSQGMISPFFSLVNPVTKTPVIATLFAVGGIYLFSLWLPLVELARMTSLFVLIVFTLVNIALIRIKLVDSRPKGALVVPLWVPILAVVMNLGLLLLQFF